MLSFRDFVAQLKAEGIQVEGESLLIEKLSSSQNWVSEAATLARAGRKLGISFTRSLPRFPRTCAWRSF